MQIQAALLCIEPQAYALPQPLPCASSFWAIVLGSNLARHRSDMQRLGALALQLVCSKPDICVKNRHHATQMLK